MSSKNFEEMANTVVRHSEKEDFLILQRSAHDSMPLSWEFPGGMEKDEDSNPREIAMRELEEETGLRPEDIVKGDSDVVELEDRYLNVHVFEAEVKEREVNLSEEHRDFQWVSKEKIEKLDMRNVMRKDLEAINEW